MRIPTRWLLVAGASGALLTGGAAGLAVYAAASAVTATVASVQPMRALASVSTIHTLAVANANGTPIAAASPNPNSPMPGGQHNCPHMSGSGSAANR